MGDDLKFIDFHQLQIENKKHVIDITNRNDKLTTYKMNAAKTSITLNSLRRRLTEAQTKQQQIESNMKILVMKQKKTQKAIEKTHDDLVRGRFEKRKLQT